MNTPGREMAGRIVKRGLAGANRVLTIAVSVVVIIIAVVLFTALVDSGDDQQPTTTTTTNAAGLAAPSHI